LKGLALGAKLHRPLYGVSNMPLKGTMRRKHCDTKSQG
jgi:hypothetical protein